MPRVPGIWYNAPAHVVLRCWGPVCVAEVCCTMHTLNYKCTHHYTTLPLAIHHNSSSFTDHHRSTTLITIPPSSTLPLSPLTITLLHWQHTTHTHHTHSPIHTHTRTRVHQPIIQSTPNVPPPLAPDPLPYTSYTPDPLPYTSYTPNPCRVFNTYSAIIPPGGFQTTLLPLPCLPNSTSPPQPLALLKYRIQSLVNRT